MTPCQPARAEVGAEVVPVLGDQQAVADLLARPPRDLTVQIEVAVRPTMLATSIRQPSRPSSR